MSSEKQKLGTLQGAIWQFIDSSNIGGIERHIEILTRALHQAGIQTQIVLYQDHGPNPWVEQLDQANLPIMMLDGSPTALQKALKAHQPALLHTHGYKASILGKVCAHLTGTPCVTTYHSGERGPFPVSLYQQADEATAFLSRAIAVSEPIKARLPKSAQLVHNFMTLPPEIRAASGKEKAKNIGFVGRFSHEKAPDLFAQLSQSLSEDKSFNWHMIGDGPMRDELQTSHASNINFHGPVTDMASIWPMLDLLIVPSRAEGLPLAVLEAMSFGIPVLASRVGALPSVIEHERNGWLYEVGDMENAKSILAAWAASTTNAQQTLAHAARETIEQHFSPEIGRSRILEIYRQTGWRPSHPTRAVA